MQKAAQNTFISSNFWTERIGSVAALETLKCMKKENSWIKISEVGIKVSDGWKNLFEKYSLSFFIGGIKPIPFFSFKSKIILL